MNRITVALLAAFDAAIAALIGIVVPLLPLTVLWAVQYGTGVDWTLFWRAAADAWLLGHGVDITARLDPTSALALGLPNGAEPFALTIAPLGFALLTVLMGARIGRRAAATPFRLVGVVSALVVFLLLSLLISLGATTAAAAVPLAQGALMPTLVLAIGVVVGAERESMRRNGPGALAGLVRDSAERIPEPGRAVVAAALRGGVLAVAVVVTAAALALTVLLVVNYSAVIALYESLGSDVVGGLVLTLGQLAFVPNLVVWAASWLVGPGFAIGTGSSVSAAGTLLGPIPSVPVLAALPQGEWAFGFAAILVPLLAGALAAHRVRPILLERLAGYSTVLWSAVTAVAMGVVSGLVLGVTAGLSGGAAGPGRLADVGPDALAVGAAVAAEVALAALLVLVAVPWLSSRLPASAGWLRASAEN